MGLPHFRGLLLHQCLRGCRKGFLQGVLVSGLGDVFPALRLRKDGVIVLTGDGRLDPEPSPVERRAHAPALLRVATQPAHFRLKFAAHLSALARVLEELCLQRRVLYPFGCLLEALFAVLARLDQIVEHRNCLIVLHHS